jgi:hypothetical protein
MFPIIVFPQDNNPRREGILSRFHWIIGFSKAAPICKLRPVLATTFSHHWIQHNPVEPRKIDLIHPPSDLPIRINQFNDTRHIVRILFQNRPIHPHPHIRRRGSNRQAPTAPLSRTHLHRQWPFPFPFPLCLAPPLSHMSALAQSNNVKPANLA